MRSTIPGRWLFFYDQELFAGLGGFRLGLEAIGGWEICCDTSLDEEWPYLGSSSLTVCMLNPVRLDDVFSVRSMCICFRDPCACQRIIPAKFSTWTTWRWAQFFQSQPCNPWIPWQPLEIPCDKTPNFQRWHSKGDIGCAKARYLGGWFSMSTILSFGSTARSSRWTRQWCGLRAWEKLSIDSHLPDVAVRCFSSFCWVTGSCWFVVAVIAE